MTATQYRTQYRTPDGSVWEQGAEGPGYFTRVSGPGSDMDFRAQKLDELLMTWGTLSLHDPLEEQTTVLAETMRRAGMLSRKDRALGDAEVRKVITELDHAGYRIGPKGQD